MTTVLPPALAYLQERPHWVCYLANKLPINPQTGEPAQAGVPTTWGSYQAALLYIYNAEGRVAGLGRELGPGEELVVVDLDDCFQDGELLPYAREEVARWNSYTEISPSGKGLHIWARGRVPGNLAQHPGEPHKYEMYAHSHYFTWTGKHLAGTPDVIEERYEVAAARYQEVTAARAALRPAKKSPALSPQTTGQKRAAAYSLAALRAECRAVAFSSPGTRNTCLNHAAFSLGQLIGEGALAREQVERELYEAGIACGLESREVVRTIRSGIDSGIEKPRQSQSEEEETWVEYQPAEGEEPAPALASNGNGNGHHPEERVPVEESVPRREPWLEAIQFSDIQLALAFTADDAGNGDALYALYGEHFLWCGAIGWFVYNGTHWEQDSEGAIASIHAVEMLRRRRLAAVNTQTEAVVKCTKADQGRVNGALARFKTLVNTPITAFDVSPDHLNCANGVVDLRSGERTPHARSQRFTYCLAAPYDPGADTSYWTTYLAGIVGGGEEMLGYLQEATGYSFTGHTREECVFYLWGPTRGGKGSYAETISELAPSPIASSMDFNSLTARRDGDVSNFDLAPLRPARILFASESQRGQSLNPAKIKQMTGGDRIRCCFKHRDFFEYRPQFKVWMLSNWEVNGDPDDDALWGRVRVIEFPNSYFGIEDKQRKARLKEPEVQQGVLAWVVEGARRWYALGSRGLISPQAVVQATRRHREELDYTQQWLDACCQDDPGGWTPNEVLSLSYLTWCRENGVAHPKSPKALAQALKAKGYEPGLQVRRGGANRRGVGGLTILSGGSEGV